MPSIETNKNVCFLLVIFQTVAHGFHISKAFRSFKVSSGRKVAEDMQFWELFVYASVVLSGLSTLKAYSSVSKEVYDDMIFLGIYCCLVFVFHPCDYFDSHRCFICLFAHERCELLKHWLLFLHVSFLTTGLVGEALAPGVGPYWFFLLLMGQLVFDVIFWFGTLSRIQQNLLYHSRFESI